jgi:ankyrin repeat protein
VALLCGGSARGRIGGGSARASAAAHAAVARRWTPLLWAAIDGHADAMAALLGAGADASIEDKFG